MAPWSRAKLWLTKEKSSMASYRSPDRRHLCEEAQAMFLAIPWAVNVHGFTNAEPTIKLASYLSPNWLATTHGDHQLDLLRWNLAHSGMNPNSHCEIVNLSFFRKMVQIYHVGDTTQYGAAEA